MPDGAPDDRRDPEFRVIQPALHGHVEVDASVDVLEQRDREFDRQLSGVGAVVLRAEREAVEVEDVARRAKIFGRVTFALAKKQIRSITGRINNFLMVKKC